MYTNKAFIVKNNQVIKIVKFEKNLDKLVKLYKNCAIILKQKSRFLEDNLKLKLGSKLPFDLRGPYVYYKTEEPYVFMSKKEVKERISSMKLYSKNRKDIELLEKRKAELKKLFSWLKSKKALDLTISIKNEMSSKNYQEMLKNEKNYRFFHTSFKIYYVRDHIFDLTRKILSLLNIDASKVKDEDLEDFCKKNELATEITDILNDTIKRVFCMNRNRKELFLKDTALLFGYQSIMESTLKSLIKVIEEIQDKKGTFWNGNNTISWDEGTFIYLTKNLNLLRYNSSDVDFKIDLNNLEDD